MEENLSLEGSNETPSIYLDWTITEMTTTYDNRDS